MDTGRLVVPMVTRSADNGSCKAVRIEFSHHTTPRGHSVTLSMQLLRNKLWIEVLTEDCSGRIVTGETGLAHTRTVECQLKSICVAVTSRAAVEVVMGALEGAWALGTRESPSTAGMAGVGCLGCQLTHCR